MRRRSSFIGIGMQVAYLLDDTHEQKIEHGQQRHRYVADFVKIGKMFWRLHERESEN